MEANHETAISHHEIMINLNCLMPFWVIAGKSPARITPAAKRNTYSVAILFFKFYPGLRSYAPQPWAGKSQLLQSCCCLHKPAARYAYD